MAAHQIRIGSSLKTLGCCLILLALFVAGISDAQAAPIVIDTFDDGQEQQAPPDSRLEGLSALGGTRLLTQVIGAATVIVAEGFLQAINASELGGTVQAVWDGGGTLGGFDLTDGGSNLFFEVVVVAPVVAPTETLSVIVEDSSNTVGRFDIGWTELVLGSNFIPFSSLTDDGVDLTSVDIVTLENVIVAPDQAIAIDSFSAVPIPEPSTDLLFVTSLAFVPSLARLARRRVSQ
jgi:hypothetical protein